jgi:hypothetical protein
VTVASVSGVHVFPLAGLCPSGPAALTKDRLRLRTDRQTHVYIAAQSNSRRWEQTGS